MLTTLGSSAVLIPIVVVSGLAWRSVRRSWAPLLLLAASYGGAELLFQVLKVVVGRARPPASMAIGHFTGLSFPSGHATLSAAVWGALAALVDRSGRAKMAAWAGAVVITLLVGLTRLYLGAHWLTDVLAGWALGAMWLAAVVVAVRRRRAVTSSRSAWP